MLECIAGVYVLQVIWASISYIYMYVCCSVEVASHIIELIIQKCMVSSSHTAKLGS